MLLKILDLTARSFASVWNNIRPKLEETIRLRREAREKRERRKRISIRERKIFEFGTAPNLDKLYIDPWDILELPQVEAMVRKEDATYELTNNDLESLRRDILELNQGRRRQILENFP